MNQHWLSTSRWREYKQVMAEVIRAGHQLNRPDIEAWACNQRGSILLSQDETEKATADLERAVNLLQEVTNRAPQLLTSLAKVLHNAGVLYETKGDIQQAASSYGKSLSLLSKSNLPTLKYLEGFLERGPDDRNWGIEGIRLSDPERALGLRLQDMTSGSKQIRLYATIGLRSFQDPRASRALIKAMSDRDMSIVIEALIGLGIVGDSSVVSELNGLWSYPAHAVRLELVRALAQIRERVGDVTQIKESLALGLNDPDSDVSAEVARTLQTSAPTPTAVPAYIEALNRQDAAGQLAKNFIRQLGPSVEKSVSGGLQHENPAIRSATIDLMADIAPTRMPEYVEHILKYDADKQVRHNAIEKLASLPLLTGEQKLGAVRTALNDREETIRVAAVRLAGELGENYGIDPLSSSLARDPSTKVRELAVDSLGRIGSPRALEAVISCLGDENTRVKIAAQRTLEANPQQAMVLLKNVLLDRTRPERIKLKTAEFLGEKILLNRIQPEHVRLEAAKVLAESAMPSAAQSLITACRNDVPTIQSAALEGLGKIGTRDTIHPIVAALTDNQTREAATRALRLITNSQTLPDLFDSSRDMPRFVQEIVSAKMVEFGSSAISFLQQKIKMDRPQTEQLTAIRLLEKMDRPEATFVLGQVLQDSTRGWGVRQEVIKAIEPLAQKSDMALDVLLSSYSDGTMRTAIRESVDRVIGNNLKRIEGKLVDFSVEPQVRIAATQILGEKGNTDQIHKLARVMANEPVIDVQVEQVRAISRIGGQEAKRILSTLPNVPLPRVVADEAEVQLRLLKGSK